jgi:hypothetical protein
MGDNNQIKLEKDFIIKLTLIPVILFLLFFCLISFFLGYDDMLVIKNHFKEIAIAFLSFEGFLMFVAFTVSGRFRDLFNDIKRKPLAAIAGLFINFGLLAYKPPTFLPDFHPFQEDLNVTLIAVAGWLAFYLISLDKIKIIISPVFVALIYVFSMIVLFVSIMFFAIVDVLSIFFWIFPIN